MTYDIFKILISIKNKNLLDFILFIIYEIENILHPYRFLQALMDQIDVVIT